jgi:hypothetical protein
MSHHETEPPAGVGLPPESLTGAETDLAQQLFALRQHPSSALRQRIQHLPRHKTNHPLLLPRWGWVAALLMALVVVGGLVSSPTAQATLGFEQWLGRIRLTVLDSYQPPTTPVVVESVPLSLAEAQAFVTYQVTAPTYVPADLVGQAEVSVLKLAVPIVRMRWRDSEGGFVQLSLLPANGRLGSNRTLVGSNSSDAVQIGPQPGVLIRGSWDAESQSWRYRQQMTTLIWEANGQQYKLLAFSDVVSLAELVRMAESVE